MKTRRLLTASLLLFSTAAMSESRFEQELKKLKSERKAALHAAAQVIDGYQEKALRDLMKRAGAAGEVETAVKIKEALDVLPQVAEKSVIGQWDLLTTTNYSSVITLQANHKGLNSAGGPFEWSIIGRTLYLGDPENGGDRYELPVKDGRLTGSNRLGNGITLTKRAEEVRPATPKVTKVEPKLPDTKEELQAYLEGTSWTELDKPENTYTFRSSGLFEGETLQPTYQVTGRRSVTMKWSPTTIIPCVFTEDCAILVEQAGEQNTFIRAKSAPQQTQQAAQIDAIHMKPTTLGLGVGKDGWIEVPAKLKHNATIYMPAGNTNGVADITVTADGVLMLACNFDYQGNSGGDWDKEIWNQARFRKEGWKLMNANDLGGALVKGDNRAQVIFSKTVRKGEKLRLRCNKYDPPYPILGSARPGAS